jgi:RNA polymerase sigma-70 factor (ECF subfamily)
MDSGPWINLADEELVVATLLGCPAAFDELVQRYRPAVRLTARRHSGDEQAVEDLCQEAFLNALLALPRLTDPARFGAWLHVIARNLALRERRSGARRRAHLVAVDPELMEEPVAPEPSPSEQFELREMRDAVREAVDSLPPAYRQVIALYYWEGMPLPRISTYLGIPLTTAKWRLRYARERLRRALELEHEADLASTPLVRQTAVPEDCAAAAP